MSGASTSTTQGRASGKSIPLLFQNRIPEGYEQEDNMDVSLRPEQSTLEDYDNVPIEEFGLAMLRGMGWKETEGIGLKNKKVVEMSVPKLRPKGMGLGAEAALANKVPQAKTGSGTGEKEDLSFKIGGFAVITKGSKRGYYGQIEAFDEDNNHVILRLSISGKMETVSKFCINIVSATEFKKSSKVINSEKYKEYKAKQEEKNLGENGRSEHSRNSRSRSNSKGSSEEREYRKTSRRKEAYRTDGSKRHYPKDPVDDYRPGERSRDDDEYRERSRDDDYRARSMDDDEYRARSRDDDYRARSRDDDEYRARSRDDRSHREMRRHDSEKVHKSEKRHKKSSRKDDDRNRSRHKHDHHRDRDRRHKHSRE